MVDSYDPLPDTGVAFLSGGAIAASESRRRKERDGKSPSEEEGDAVWAGSVQISRGVGSAGRCDRHASRSRRFYGGRIRQEECQAPGHVQ